MSFLRIAGPQVRGVRVIGISAAIGPPQRLRRAGALQQRQRLDDALPNRRRKSGSLKEPLSGCIMGPFVSENWRKYVEPPHNRMASRGGTSMIQPTLLGGRSLRLEALAKIVSLIVALNQFTYAFDPRVLGAIRDVTGS